MRFMGRFWWAVAVLAGLLACGSGDGVGPPPRAPAPVVTVPSSESQRVEQAGLAPSPTAASALPGPTGLRSDRPDAHADEQASARERGLAALREAKLEQLVLLDHPRREERSDGAVWLFEIGDAREHIGWLVVPEHGGDITVEALENQLSIEAWQEQRRRAAAASDKVNRLGVIRDFCQWVSTTHQRRCMVWVEAAPAPDCKSDCYWQYYVGSADEYAASRHFSLLFADTTGKLLVNQMGERIPLAKWRATQPF
jgi:hypothetical protein